LAQKIYGGAYFCMMLAESDGRHTRHQSAHAWTDHVIDNIKRFIYLPFIANMSEKHKSTSPSATQVKKVILMSYCLLRNALHCCHHRVGKVTNKYL
jgi:hypothetical protein